MTQIIAHRANITGPGDRENTEEAIRACIDRGWGLELDIRRTPSGRFYCSHDAAECTNANDALRILDLLAGSTVEPIAVNIKELGYEPDLLELLADYDMLGRAFLFDMELIEEIPGTTARLLKRLQPSVRVAARVSDRCESIERALSIEEADVVWLDEFDSLWVRESDIRRLRAAGKSVHAVSPELHGFSVGERDRRWRDLLGWKVDGVCTDYPALFETAAHAAGKCA